MSNTVVFSHGKESGPWGKKITAMAAMVRGLGYAVESVDYRGIDDPRRPGGKARRRRLAIAAAPILVGSSMGGHVAAAAAPQLHPAAFFSWRPLFTCGASKPTRHRTSRVRPPSFMAGTMTSCRSRTAFVGRASTSARCTFSIRIIAWRIASTRSATCCGAFSPSSGPPRRVRRGRRRFGKRNPRRCAVLGRRVDMRLRELAQALAEPLAGALSHGVETRAHRGVVCSRRSVCRRTIRGRTTCA